MEEPDPKIKNVLAAAGAKICSIFSSSLTAYNIYIDKNLYTARVVLIDPRLSYNPTMFNWSLCTAKL